MDTPIDKRELLDLARASLAAELEVLRRAANAAREAATHEENKPENDKDTRAIEAGYLAGAQAERARALETAIAALAVLRPRAFAEDEPAALGALVELVELGELDERERRGAGRGRGPGPRLYFLAPEGGGLEIEARGARVALVTPRSPLGSALVGRTAGEEIELGTPRGRRRFEIGAVR